MRGSCGVVLPLALVIGGCLGLLIVGSFALSALSKRIMAKHSEIFIISTTTTQSNLIIRITSQMVQMINGI